MEVRRRGRTDLSKVERTSRVDLGGTTGRENRRKIRASPHGTAAAKAQDMSKACLSVSPVSSLESIAIVPESPESGVFPAEQSTQVRLSLVPRPAPMLTLPPPVRAAKMLKSVRSMAASIARRLPRHVEV